MPGILAARRAAAARAQRRPVSISICSPKTSSKVRSPWGTIRQSGSRVPMGPAMRTLFCEQRVKVLEGLELQRVARWIEEEHGGLLARFALETHIRLDNELRAGLLQLFGQHFPDRHFKHRAKVAYRHVVVVNTAGLCAA